MVNAVRATRVVSMIREARVARMPKMLREARVTRTARATMVVGAASVVRQVRFPWIQRVTKLP